MVTGVTLDTTSMTLGVGDSKRISYTVAPDYATIDDMTSTSGDTSVATVGADGTVTAVAPGATAITVASTAAGISKTVDVTVARMAPNLTGGIVDPDTQYTQKRFDEVKALTTNNRALKAWKNDKVNSEISLAAVGTTVSNLTVTASDLTSSSPKATSRPRSSSPPRHTTAAISATETRTARCPPPPRPTAPKATTSSTKAARSR